MEGTTNSQDAERARMEEHQRRAASAHHTATGGAPAPRPAAPAPEPPPLPTRGAAVGARPAATMARQPAAAALADVERFSAALAGCLTPEGELLRPAWREDATVRLLLALADAVLALADADPDGAP